MNKVERGSRAQLVISDPLFQEAAEAIKRQLTERIVKSSPADAAIRERWYLAHTLVDEVVGMLNQFVEEGRREQHGSRSPIKVA